MSDQPPAIASGCEPSANPALLRTLADAGLPAHGHFHQKSSWVSRAWVGEHYVVRLNPNDQFRRTYQHEASVADLLAGSAVPHARRIAHGDGPDGPWYISERLPGRTLHDTWPEADTATRRSIIESLGRALRALHQIPVPAGLLPPWLTNALSGQPWPAYHPPVVGETLQQVDAARRQPDHDPRLLADVAQWIEERLPLFAGDHHVLVHGDLHGSNVIVNDGRVTGLIDFAEALAQPADVELDTILRWCARPREFPPTPDEQGLDRASLADVPRWLRLTYPELFSREQLRVRLNFYDMYVELSLYAHHPHPDVRGAARASVASLLTGHSHLDRFSASGLLGRVGPE